MMYFPAFGSLHAAEAVLIEQRRVVGGGDFEALLIEDSHRRIEKRAAEPQAFDFNGDTIPLGSLNDEVVDVLIWNDAIDDGAELDRLRTGKAVVGFLLDDLGQRADVKGPQIRESAGRSYPHGVNAKWAISGDRQFHFRLVVVDPLDAVDLNARFVEQQLLWVLADATADQRHLDFGSALTALGSQVVQSRARGAGDRAGCEQQQNEGNRSHANSWSASVNQARSSRRTEPPLTISMGRPPGAISSFSAAMPS
jgi:hypothetical protein